MAVTKPKSGETVSPSSITGMYDSVKTLVNNMPVGSISDSCFGTQHLPSVTHVSSDSAGTKIAYTTKVPTSGSFPKDITSSAAQIISETQSDVTSNWTTLMNLNGTGTGYPLKPCQVLVMFDATVSLFDKAANGNGKGQAWFSLYYTADIGSGTATYWSATNLGMVRNRINPLTTAALENGEVHDSISIWTVIDRTSLTSNWTLKDVIVKCAVGTGLQGAGSRTPVKFVVNNAKLSIVGFYRDA